jgi:hypothetical protein
LSRERYLAGRKVLAAARAASGYLFSVFGFQFSVRTEATENRKLKNLKGAAQL